MIYLGKHFEAYALGGSGSPQLPELYWYAVEAVHET
jgi:hypothetical protein